MHALCTIYASRLNFPGHHQCGLQLIYWLHTHLGCAEPWWLVWLVVAVAAIEDFSYYFGETLWHLVKATAI